MNQNILPHHIIKCILEYILNQCSIVEYVVVFMKKYTLISREWNVKIIPKVQLYNDLHILSNLNRPELALYRIFVEALLKLYQISNRFHWYNFGLITREYKEIQFLQDRFRVVSQSKAYPITSGSHELKSKYKNLELLNLELQVRETGNQKYGKEFKQYFNNLICTVSDQSAKSVTCNLKIKATKDDIVQLSTEELETIFNSSCLKSISLDEIKLNIPVKYDIENFQPNRLVTINLWSVSMDKWVFEMILHCSQHYLKRLELNYIQISDTNTSLTDIVSQLTTSSLSMNLQNLIIRSTFSISFSSYIEFLNQVKSKEVLLQAKFTSELATVPEFSINNSNIECFSFCNDFVYCNKVPIRVSLFDSWKSKSSLKSVLIDRIQVQTSCADLVNLTSVRYSTNNLEQLLNFNLPKLTDLHRSSYMLSNEDTNSIVNSKYLQKITLTHLDFAEYLKLVTVDHPSLVSMTLEYVNSHNGPMDLPIMIDSIKKNRNLTYLDIKVPQISSFTGYDKYKAFVEILSVNHNLQSLYLPNRVQAHYPHHIPQFQQLLSINKTIQNVGLFELPRNAITCSQIKQNILEVFASHCVNCQMKK
ncbi:hypothetical protein DLAC_00895 [Tieghemostelium lacteum]|uniref:Uncharacterized protein n=1 Tax=Tieghemostelium lacteum TaxID=361077 RepID=A0A152A7J1_TIELA|nr:hypothetical protein DLAC_00895 [Tieghemostelium lacteum]|eukprot:KYR02095.1 hypothetical protein DLAC_00895 [Tieghemostelium lacteum]